MHSPVVNVLPIISPRLLRLAFSVRSLLMLLFNFEARSAAHTKNIIAWDNFLNKNTQKKNVKRTQTMSTRSAKGGRATNERTTIVETENTCLEIYTQFIKFYRKGQDRPLTGRESIFISIS